MDHLRHFFISRSLLRYWFLLLALLTACGPQSKPFDLMAASEAVNVEPVIEMHRIHEREVQIWSWPHQGRFNGVILFSHGFASAPWKYDPQIHIWSAAGYTVYAPLHVDSTDHPQTADYKGMASWLARMEDMHLLANLYGNDGYVAAGHSYGGLVALTKGGVSASVPQAYNGLMADDRVTAVLAFSPPGAMPGFADKTSLSTLAVPALIQTGTLDKPQMSDAGWETHLDAYNAASVGGQRYALILDGVDHYFGGEICRPELDAPKQTKEIAVAAEISVLMLQSFNENNLQAKNTLTSRLSNSGDVVLMTK